jgi:hypothetical protein
MALTARVLREFVGEQDEISVLLADSDIYYAGGIVCNSSGKGAFISAVAENQAALGILTGKYDDGDSVDAKTIGASNTVRAIIKRGKVWLPHASAAQTDVGGLFTPDSDNSMADVPTTANKRYIGYMALDYKTNALLFDLRNPMVADNET